MWGYDFAGSSRLLVVWAWCSAGCKDDFEGHESGTFSGAGSAGRRETEFEGSLHDFPNSLVAVGTANAMEDVGGAGARGRGQFLTIMWWNSGICCWRPLLSRGLCCIDLIQGIHSLVIHPCMRLLLHVCLMVRVVGSVGCLSSGRW